MPDGSPTWLIIARDVVAAMAAVTGATVAVIGLRSWRSKLRTDLDIELGRRLLRAVLSARDATREFRNPFGYYDPEDETRRKQGTGLGRLTKDRQDRWARLSKQMGDTRIWSRLRCCGTRMRCATSTESTPL